MKIGVTSDTHGSFYGWKKAMKIFSGADMIVHAGDLFYYGPRDPLPDGFFPGRLAKEMKNLDIPIVAARGNCDSDVDGAVAGFPIQEPFAFLQVGSLRVLVNHGDKIKEEEKIKLAKKWNVNIFVLGHTHYPEINRVEKTVFLNPGSPSLPKEGPPTAAIVEEKDGEVDIKIFNLETGKVLME